MTRRSAFFPIRGLFLASLALLALLPFRQVVAQDNQETARLFETEVAPILAKHCLECHSSAKAEGNLNLARQSSAREGGESGPAWKPGDAEESLLWQLIEADEMPQNRPPLSAQEKQSLKRWLDAGALWTLREIDPASHLLARKAENWVQRLTQQEYIETVRQTFGINIELDAQKILPPDVRADGFSNTAYGQTIDLEHVEAYAKLAELVVSRIDPVRFASQFSKRKSLAEKDMRELISKMGRRVLRGPLTDREVKIYLQIPKVIGREKGTYAEAVRYLLTAMLQSPRFIYRLEQQTGEGPTIRPNQFELANRLSYIVWGGPPDETLLALASTDKLQGRELEHQVDRMLSDPRAVDQSIRFVQQWLDLGRLKSLRPNEEHFPNWDAALAEDMQDETLAFFREVAWQQKRPLADLMNAQVTVVSPRLARFYQLGQGEAGDNIATNTSDGLLALYNFESGSGDRIRESLTADASLGLRIFSPANVQWTTDGLEVLQPTRIATEKPPQRLVRAIQKSNEMTIEAWLTPADDQQEGPARIVSISNNPSQRNFTLGQDKDKFDFRLRAKGTDRNGIPSVSSKPKSARSEKTHVVFTCDTKGTSRLYINGKLEGERKNIGPIVGWDGSYQLVLANEATNDRPWLGTLHRVAIYDRALSESEILSQSQPIKKYDLTEIPHRGGLLTQGSTLTMGGDHASMVTRGLFILHELLYSRVGQPPPCVDTTPIPTKPGLTKRDVALQRINNNACGGCHSRFEPLAFGLERFDGIGVYHEQDEHGNALRDDGEIILPGAEKPVSYQSSKELMDILASSERVRMGITRKITQFALGRPLVQEDEAYLNPIHQQAQQQGGTYAALVKAIVLSDLVQTTRVVQPDDAN